MIFDDCCPSPFVYLNEGGRQSSQNSFIEIDRWMT